MCVDSKSISVQNRAFRQPEYDKDGFINTNNEVIFMNGIVYRRNEKTEHSRIQLFVAESKFNRSISAITKAASNIK